MVDLQFGLLAEADRLQDTDGCQTNKEDGDQSRHVSVTRPASTPKRATLRPGKPVAALRDLSRSGVERRRSRPILDRRPGCGGPVFRFWLQAGSRPLAYR